MLLKAFKPTKITTTNHYVDSISSTEKKKQNSTIKIIHKMEEYHPTFKIESKVVELGEHGNKLIT